MNLGKQTHPVRTFVPVDEIEATPAPVEPQPADERVAVKA